MGCGQSKMNGSYYSLLPEGKFTKVYESWKKVEETCQKKTNKRCVQSRSGWQTVRIFVSSTFKDFHAEREALVKKTFPKLRLWCEEQLLHLIECDLR